MRINGFGVLDDALEHSNVHYYTTTSQVPTHFKYIKLHTEALDL